MRRRILAVALAVALCGLIAVPALAQNAEPEPARSLACEAQAQAEDAGGRAHSHGDGDELAQGRSRPAAGSRERLGKLEASARCGESRQAGIG